MKPPARRAGLPGEVLSFKLCPLIPPTRRSLRGTFRPKGIGWLSWGQFKGFLEITKARSRTELERVFTDPLILYLDHKIKEAERIRNERKQLSFW